MQMRILVVDDDAAISASIEGMLKDVGFNTYATDFGEDAVDLGKLYDYDVMLLDLNLPDKSGYEVLHEWRTANVKTPVIVLSGLSGPGDMVKALNMGADDYITKPFYSEVLIARINAVVRRTKGFARSVIEHGDLTLSITTRTVELKGVRLALSGSEYTFLELLMLRRHGELSQAAILDHMYGGIDEPDRNVICVFAAKIRKILSKASKSKDCPFGKKYFDTVRGFGYKLLSPDKVVPNEKPVRRLSPWGKKALKTAR